LGLKKRVARCGLQVSCKSLVLIILANPLLLCNVENAPQNAPQERPKHNSSVYSGHTNSVIPC